jgi:hypothetical protein
LTRSGLSAALSTCLSMNEIRAVDEAARPVFACWPSA